MINGRVANPYQEQKTFTFVRQNDVVIVSCNPTVLAPEQFISE